MRSLTAKITIVSVAAAALLVLAAAGATQNASAQTGDPLKITLTLKKIEKNSQGKETLTNAAAVKPGDFVEYQAVYKNSDKAPMRKLTANLPIPQGMDYVAKSAQPDKALASTDGKVFAPEPLKRTVKKDGKTVTENVPASEYRFLRWEIKELGAGKDFVVKARAKVSQTPAQPAPKQAAGARQGGEK